MSRINLLDENTINKIAAGEVVERPSSIIKELMENSIDAGSKNITVEIENSGKDLIRVIDDGCGIEKNDVRKAFLRHTTSKISTAEDLNSLYTLGFRGEALASISAVSKLEMITKTQEELVATKYMIEGGRETVNEAYSANRGTKISVLSLFYNTPARRKFMKSTHTEYLAITSIVNKISIGNPNIKIKYISNGRLVYETLGDGSQKNAIRTIFGKDITQNLIDVDYSATNFKISGYIGNNNIYRSNKNLQYIYINGRYVNSRNIMSTINDSYKSIIPINKYPIYFFNIDLKPSEIDVNIHPNKLEVKFSNENSILSEIGDNIRGILLKRSLTGKYSLSTSNNDSPIKNYSNYNSFTYSKKEQGINLNELRKNMEVREREESDFKSNKKEKLGYDYKSSQNNLSLDDKKIENDIKTRENLETKISKDQSKSQNSDDGLVKKYNMDGEFSSLKKLSEYEKSYNENQLEITEVNDNISYDKSERAFKDLEEKINPRKESFLVDEYFSNLSFVGIIFDTYIIFQKGNIMKIFDQHAAHERVNFERYMKKFRERKISIQTLIEPIVIDLSPEDMSIVVKNLEIFEKFGFIVEEYGLRSICVRGVPNSFGYPESEKFIYEVIDNITSAKDISDLKYDEIAEISCKASIKGKDKIGRPEAEELIKQLSLCENKYTCPHGRPIIVEITNYDLEKMFKRKM